MHRYASIVLRLLLSLSFLTASPLRMAMADVEQPPQTAGAHSTQPESTHVCVHGDEAEGALPACCEAGQCSCHCVSMVTAPATVVQTVPGVDPGAAPDVPIEIADPGLFHPPRSSRAV